MALGRLDAQGARQATVEVGTAEVGFRQVDGPVAMGVEGTRQVAQGGVLAQAGFAGKQTDTGRLQQPVERPAPVAKSTALPQSEAVLSPRRVPPDIGRASIR